jgi:hypothetical protein
MNDRDRPNLNSLDGPRRSASRAGRVACALAGMLIVLSATDAAAAQAERGPRTADRTLQLLTSGSLILTATLGTINAINQPTWFSDGRCAAGDPIFGDYGCHGFGTLHGISALLSLVLYTATETLEFADFDWPGRDRHGAGYDALSYVHLVGMALQPLGGLLAAVPQVIGLKRDSAFTKALRSIHVMTGSVIVTAFVVTTAIEL